MAKDYDHRRLQAALQDHAGCVQWMVEGLKVNRQVKDRVSIKDILGHLNQHRKLLGLKELDTSKSMQDRLSIVLRKVYPDMRKHLDHGGLCKEKRGGIKTYAFEVVQVSFAPEELQRRRLMAKALDPAAKTTMLAPGDEDLDIMLLLAKFLPQQPQSRQDDNLLESDVVISDTRALADSSILNLQGSEATSTSMEVEDYQQEAVFTKSNTVRKENKEAITEPPAEFAIPDIHPNTTQNQPPQEADSSVSIKKELEAEPFDSPTLHDASVLLILPPLEAAEEAEPYCHKAGASIRPAEVPPPSAKPLQEVGPSTKALLITPEEIAWMDSLQKNKEVQQPPGEVAANKLKLYQILKRTDRSGFHPYSVPISVKRSYTQVRPGDLQFKRLVELVEPVYVREQRQIRFEMETDSILEEMKVTIEGWWFEVVFRMLEHGHSSKEIVTTLRGVREDIRKSTEQNRKLLGPSTSTGSSSPVKPMGQPVR